MEPCQSPTPEALMDTTPAFSPPAASATVFVAGVDDDEVPLGWECANPALQIECWGTDEPGAAGLVSES